MAGCITELELRAKVEHATWRRDICNDKELDTLAKLAESDREEDAEKEGGGEESGSEINESEDGGEDKDEEDDDDFGEGGVGVVKEAVGEYDDPSCGTVEECSAAYVAKLMAVRREVLESAREKLR